MEQLLPDYDLENTILWELRKIKAVAMVMECCDCDLEAKIIRPIGKVVLDHLKNVDDYIAILENRKGDSNLRSCTVKDIESENIKLKSLMMLLDFCDIESVDTDYLHYYCELVVDINDKISRCISSQLLIRQGEY